MTTCTSPRFFYFSFFPFLIPPFSLDPRHSSAITRYLSALLEQPHARILPAPLDTLVPVALFVLGQTYVVTSTWALGITGTFLGDYFGILMDHRVEGFPFNVLRDPMYVGSTMCFAATALWCASPLSRHSMRVDVSFLQVRAPRWFVDHIVRPHRVYDRAQV